MAKYRLQSSPPQGRPYVAIVMQQNRDGLRVGQTGYIPFDSVAEAQADVQQHGAGTVYAGTGQSYTNYGAASYGQAQSSAPYTSTGWYRVASGGRSWLFSDYNLALRCAQAHGTSVSAGNPPSSQWRHMANQQGPTYR